MASAYHGPRTSASCQLLGLRGRGVCARGRRGCFRRLRTAAENAAFTMAMAVENSSMATKAGRHSCPFSGIRAGSRDAPPTGSAPPRERLRRAGSRTPRLVLSLQALELDALRLGAASSWRSLTSSRRCRRPALHLIDALLHRSLAQGRELALLLEAVDDLQDFGLDLAFETREVGAQLAHARMSPAAASLTAPRAGAPGARAAARGSGSPGSAARQVALPRCPADNLAHRAGPRSASLRCAFAARVGGEVAELLLVEAGLLGPPLKMLAWPRKCSTSASASATSLTSCRSSAEQRLAARVARATLGGDHRAVGLGDAVGDVAANCGSSEVKRMPMKRLSFAE